MLYITIIFLYESTGSCFKSAIGIIKTHLKVHRSSCFHGGGRENFLLEKFDDSAHFDLPFWGNLNIDLCFSFKSQLKKQFI